MASDRKEQLPASLERQLRRIEQIGNAEADLFHQEQWLRPADGKATRPATKTFPTRTAHRRYTQELRLRRENERTRKLGIALLCLSPFLSLGYVVAGIYERSQLALVFMMAAGFALGFALIVLYYANRRLQEQ